MALSDIKHVFVLMLENRSFDHIFGAVSLNGVGIDGAPLSADGIAPGTFSNTGSDGTVYTNAVGGDPAAPMSGDPPHEYDNVVMQMLGDNRDSPLLNNPPYNYASRPIDLSGFVKSYQTTRPVDPSIVLKSYPDGSSPNLTSLARSYCVCDRWFSSLPGPTVPNRFFLVAATSGGNPKSPGGLRMGTGEFLDPFVFKNGNIFKRIKEQTKMSFRVYRGDAFPFCALMDGVHYLDDTVPYSKETLAADCNAPSVPDFVFIEPSYDILDSFKSSTSQHPLSNLKAGDDLVGEVYTAISQSACWKNSLLIITYDEHGGFFDHVVPPKTVAPGDVPNVYDFDFTQLGVRVPAVIVSPQLIRRHCVDRTVYDHTSVLATMEDLFPQIGTLGAFTMRDRMAHSLTHLFDGTAADLTPTPL